MFKIERALTGLFGAFKLQSQGNLPIALREDVQATIDLNRWALAASGLRTQNFSIVTAGVGVLVSYTQPEDWLVVGAGCYWIAGAIGDANGLALCLRPGGANSSAQVYQSYLRPTSAAWTSAIGIGEKITCEINHIPEPFFSRAGTIWQMANYYTAGTNCTFISEIAHYKLVP